MTDPVPSLQGFLSALDRRLQEMSTEEIRESLLVHAQGLPSADRDSFLAVFATTDPTEEAVWADQAEKPLDITWPVDRHPLLDEIDVVVARVASGAYFEGFGWDNDVHEERSFGDESWVWEFDDLFSGAQNAFLAGRVGLARAAYQRLLEAFALDEEVGLSRGDAAQVTAARRAAWRASPNQARLLALHRAATHTSEADDVMVTELAALEASGTLGRLHGGLRTVLMLLAGRTTPRSCCAGPQHPEWPSTRLAGLLAAVDNANLWDRWADFGRPDHSRPYDDDTPPLAELLVDQISTEAADERVLSQRLNVAVQEVDRQVVAIVSGKARGQYTRAAQLLTCCAEALTMANGAEAGIALVGRWRARYPRHSSFQRELSGAIGKTPLVSAAPRGTAP